MPFFRVRTEDCRTFALLKFKNVASQPIEQTLHIKHTVMSELLCSCKLLLLRRIHVSGAGGRHHGECVSIMVVDP